METLRSYWICNGSFNGIEKSQYYRNYWQVRYPDQRIEDACAKCMRDVFTYKDFKPRAHRRRDEKSKLLELLLYSLFSGTSTVTVDGKLLVFKDLFWIVFGKTSVADKVEFKEKREEIKKCAVEILKGIPIYKGTSTFARNGEIWYKGAKTSDVVDEACTVAVALCDAMRGIQSPFELAMKMFTTDTRAFYYLANRIGLTPNELLAVFSLQIPDLQKCYADFGSTFFLLNEDVAAVFDSKGKPLMVNANKLMAEVHSDELNKTSTKCAKGF